MNGSLVYVEVTFSPLGFVTRIPTRVYVMCRWSLNPLTFFPHNSNLTCCHVSILEAVFVINLEMIQVSAEMVAGTYTISRSHHLNVCVLAYVISHVNTSIALMNTLRDHL